MRIKKRILALFVIVFFSLIFVQAVELELNMEAKIGSFSENFVTETNSLSSIGLDLNDIRIPPSPQQSEIVFYSSVSSDKLILDSWNSNVGTRTINLVVSSSQIGECILSWQSFTNSFDAELYSCGTDSSFSNCGSSINMADQRSLSVQKNNLGNIYFKMIINKVSDSPITGGNISGNNGGSGGGGGGGATTQKNISMKIYTDKTFFIEGAGETNFDFFVDNNGQTDFNNVLLTYTGKNLQIKEPIILALKIDKIIFLQAGKKETIEGKATILSAEPGVYELEINATSTIPKYFSSGKIYLTVIGQNGTGIIKVVAFTEGMINENAPCYELRGMLEEAKADLTEGNLQSGLEKSQRALEACNNLLNAKKATYSNLDREQLISYLFWAILGAIALGLIFNIYKLWRFGKLRKFFKSEYPSYK